MYGNMQVFRAAGHSMSCDLEYDVMVPFSSRVSFSSLNLVLNVLINRIMSSSKHPLLPRGKAFCFTPFMMNAV